MALRRQADGTAVTGVSYKIVTATGGDGNGDLEVACPEGYVVVGGGCTNNGSNGSGGPCEDSVLEASLPKDSRTWACGMENCNDVLAKAICLAAAPVGSLTVE